MVSWMYLFVALLVLNLTHALKSQETALVDSPRVVIVSLGDDVGFNTLGFPHGPLGTLISRYVLTSISVVSFILSCSI